MADVTVNWNNYQDPSVGGAAPNGHNLYRYLNFPPNHADAPAAYHVNHENGALNINPQTTTYLDNTFTASDHGKAYFYEVSAWKDGTYLGPGEEKKSTHVGPLYVPDVATELAYNLGDPAVSSSYMLQTEPMMHFDANRISATSEFEQTPLTFRHSASYMPGAWEFKGASAAQYPMFFLADGLPAMGIFDGTESWNGGQQQFPGMINANSIIYTGNSKYCTASPDGYTVFQVYRTSFQNKWGEAINHGITNAMQISANLAGAVGINRSEIPGNTTYEYDTTGVVDDGAWAGTVLPGSSPGMNGSAMSPSHPAEANGIHCQRLNNDNDAFNSGTIKTQYWDKTQAAPVAESTNMAANSYHAAVQDGATTEYIAAAFSVAAANLGGQYFPVNVHHKGVVHEYLIFPTAISAADVSKVMEYLVAKWFPNDTFQGISGVIN